MSRSRPRPGGTWSDAGAGRRLLATSMAILQEERPGTKLACTPPEAREAACSMESMEALNREAPRPPTVPWLCVSCGGPLAPTAYQQTSCPACGRRYPIDTRWNGPDFVGEADGALAGEQAKC